MAALGRGEEWNPVKREKLEVERSRTLNAITQVAPKCGYYSKYSHLPTCLLPSLQTNIQYGMVSATQKDMRTVEDIQADMGEKTMNVDQIKQGGKGMFAIKIF